MKELRLIKKNNRYIIQQKSWGIWWTEEELYSYYGFDEAQTRFEAVCESKQAQEQRRREGVKILGNFTVDGGTNKRQKQVIKNTPDEIALKDPDRVDAVNKYKWAMKLSKKGWEIGGYYVETNDWRAAVDAVIRKEKTKK